MYIITLYTLNYYEGKYFISLFMPTILHILLKISINNHPLLYIHINTHKYA